MIECKQLIQHLDALLQSNSFKDYCPNGLQIAGRERVATVVTGVTASQALIDAAVAMGADTLLVHHGYFWRGEDERLLGIKRERIKTLLLNDINLIAYHLPLDAHPLYGNNIQLAQMLNFKIDGPVNDEPGQLVLKGRLPRPMSGAELAAWLHGRLDREPLHIGEDNDVIETVGWCTGAAQGYLSQAIDAGVDAYITGEVNESTVHLARETGTHFYSAGHHATERYGVRALGEHLAEHFGLQVEFIDIDNPV